MFRGVSIITHKAISVVMNKASESKRLIYFLCIILIFLLLSGCINETIYIDSTPAAIRTHTFVVYQTILQAQKLTMTASVRQTNEAQEILQVSKTAGQLQAIQTAEAQAIMRTAEISQHTSTVAFRQTEDAFNTVRTGVSLTETSNRIAYQEQNRQLDIQRRSMLNSIFGFTIILLIIGFCALLVWGFWHLLRVSMERRLPTEPSPNSVMVWDHYGHRFFVRPTSEIEDSSFSEPNVYAPADASDHAHDREARVASTQDTRPLRRRPEIPVVASWKKVCDEWQGGSMPLGMADKGMITIHPNENPHLLFTGAAGSGKTRFAMRPLAAAALADGWQVVIFNRKDADYTLFCEYPNVNYISLGNHHSADAIRYLARINAEICRRIGDLDKFQVSSWLERGKGAHRTLVMIDDFQEIIPGKTTPEDRNKLLQAVRSITADGHRAGIHLFIAMRDTSYSDLDAHVRPYMRRVCFQVCEAHISRVIFNTDGAEALCPRQFMALLAEELVYGFAFAPDDAGIMHLLDKHTPILHHSPTWLINP